MLFPTNSKMRGRVVNPTFREYHTPSMRCYYTPLFAVCQQRIFPNSVPPPFSTSGGNGMGGCVFTFRLAKGFGEGRTQRNSPAAARRHIDARADSGAVAHALKRICARFRSVFPKTIV